MTEGLMVADCGFTLPPPPTPEELEEELRQNDARCAVLLAEAQDPATRSERLTAIVEDLESGGFPGIPRIARAPLAYVDQSLRGDPWWERKFQEKSVADRVAVHPQTPPKTLVRLAEVSAPALCKNPLLPLLLLEYPTFVSELTLKGKWALLHCPDLPEAIVQTFASDTSNPQLADEARLHIHFAAEPGAGWAEDVTTYWRTVAAQYRNTSVVIEEAHIELIELELAPRWICGPEPWTAPDLMQIVRSHPPSGREDAAGYTEAAKDRRATEHLLRRLSRHPAWEVRFAVAANPLAPESLLRDILQDSFYQETWELMRIAIVLNPNAPSGLLQEVARKGGSRLRRAILRRATVSAHLEVLCRSALTEQVRGGNTTSPLVHFSVLLQPELPSSWLCRAADSDRWHERLAAALNPQSAMESGMLADLASDANRLVRIAARGRLRGEHFRWV